MFIISRVIRECLIYRWVPSIWDTGAEVEWISEHKESVSASVATQIPVEPAHPSTHRALGAFSLESAVTSPFSALLKAPRLLLAWTGFENVVQPFDIAHELRNTINRKTRDISTQSTRLSLKETCWFYIHSPVNEGGPFTIILQSREDEPPTEGQLDT